ncbi:MAG: arylesterase [Bacteroidetes bacterium]|nr:arylesterase [Bacteroidota bacterium]MDA1118923.1 arylesterase [Bacteroidota bacterium]
MKFPHLLFFILTIGCTSSTNNRSKTESQPESVSIESFENKKTIVFFGNSLTAGYGIDISEAFPAIIQEIVDSLSLQYQVINAGLSGETTASGSSRIAWVLKNKIDIFILELGGNDGLRGIPTSETRKNLHEIIKKVRNNYPEVKIVLAGMQVPPNMGPEYSADFKSIFPEVATASNTALIPFLLENVGGEPNLNLDDGIHPTPEGHKLVAMNVWAVLEPLL